MLRVLLDMDGVIADFGTAAFKACGCEPFPIKEWAVEDKMGVSIDEFYRRCAGHDFWLNIPKMVWADRLVTELEAFSCIELGISTSPMRDPYCDSGKKAWIMKHYPQLYSKTMIGGKKHWLANSNTILIDDKNENVWQFRDAGGRAILFPALYNNNASLLVEGFDVVNFVLLELEELL